MTRTKQYNETRVAIAMSELGFHHHERMYMASSRYRHKVDYIGNGVLRHPDGPTEQVSYVINHYLVLETTNKEAPHGHDLLTGRIRSLDRPTAVDREEFLDDARWGTVFTLVLSAHGTQLSVRLQADGQIIPVGDLMAC